MDYLTLLKSFKNLIIEMITSYIVFLWCPILLPGNINQTEKIGIVRTRLVFPTRLNLVAI